jgi:type II restriction/modification system DNA methylase subunit YeeA
MATTADKTTKLTQFTDWVATHIKGDEKGEAQIFLDRLFQAFGHAGLKEAGADCEERIKNDTGGTSFADLVWKPVVVIEMKKRGVDLRKHYSQAFTYWTRLVPARPRYAVLCNFDEFWVYDFETQLDTPVDTVKLSELPNKFGPLNFLFPGDIAPVFGNHQESVTRKAADKLAACFNSMTKRGVAQTLAQRFTLQMLMALFAEDIGLLDKYFVTGVLDECKSPQDTYDLLGGLFDAMNTKGGVTGGRFKGVAYFNGGLFAEPAHVELIADERVLLKEASQFDWSKVRPEIFGTIFEHSLGKEARHATGAHFTSPVDIMKVVGPTIVAPWSVEVEAASTLSRLKELLARIESFTVLDPACGSGNFLYVAYREMKRLHAPDADVVVAPVAHPVLLRRIDARRGGVRQPPIGHDGIAVHAQQPALVAADFFPAYVDQHRIAVALDQRA